MKCAIITSVWFNDASLANYLAAVRDIRSKHNIGRILLLGVSMGGGGALNLMAHRDFPTAAAVPLIGGVGDLDTLYTGRTGAYYPGIEAAYGFTGAANYEAATAGHNRIDREGWEFRGVPMRSYTSDGDTAVPRATNADAIAANVLPYSPEAAVISGTGGHLDASQFQASDLLAFFNRYRLPTIGPARRPGYTQGI